jgi:hypothetical protein
VKTYLVTDDQQKADLLRLMDPELIADSSLEIYSGWGWSDADALARSLLLKSQSRVILYVDADTTGADAIEGKRSFLTTSLSDVASDRWNLVLATPSLEGEAIQEILREETATSIASIRKLILSALNDSAGTLSVAELLRVIKAAHSPPASVQAVRGFLIEARAIDLVTQWLTRHAWKVHVEEGRSASFDVVASRDEHTIGIEVRHQRSGINQIQEVATHRRVRSPELTDIAILLTGEHARAEVGIGLALPEDVGLLLAAPPWRSVEVVRDISAGFERPKTAM